MVRSGLILPYSLALVVRWLADDNDVMDFSIGRCRSFPPFSSEAKPHQLLLERWHQGSGYPCHNHNVDQ
jgi:hypothetical protein